MSKPRTGADPERLTTWHKYRNGLCDDCRATCCTLPAEVRVTDLIRLGVMDAFEAEEPLKPIARRLEKAGLIEHFNLRSGLFTLARRANGDCVYLDAATRRCTVYERRPDTCRNHPRIGPRPGYCAYIPQT
ncbi:YkgJ family cysteine cluster protein [Sulfurivermis fontis]|jgi:Fe-S-cluster containining protein|uniref:YkgJ family cysteine cluster protein n=1 Tax=Sulfurivermis fontis TaxID=1972068 RepID=UPI000FD6F5A9|nr:YkgJ family cysteine cluster protein [Sulfurivermis fontis]